jgi:hypothetical protein
MLLQCAAPSAVFWLHNRLEVIEALLCCRRAKKGEEDIITLPEFPPPGVVSACAAFEGECVRCARWSMLCTLLSFTSGRNVW